MQIKPNARLSGFIGLSADQQALVVAVAAPACDNKANQALIEFLSRALSIRKSLIEIARGAHSRHKHVRINMQVQTAEQCVKNILHNFLSLTE